MTSLPESARHILQTDHCKFSERHVMPISTASPRKPLCALVACIISVFGHPSQSHASDGCPCSEAYTPNITWISCEATILPNYVKCDINNCFGTNGYVSCYKTVSNNAKIKSCGSANSGPCSIEMKTIGQRYMNHAVCTFRQSPIPYFSSCEPVCNCNEIVSAVKMASCVCP